MTEVTKEFIQKNEDEKIIEIEIERLRSFKNHPLRKALMPLQRVCMLPIANGVTGRTISSME